MIKSVEDLDSNGKSAFVRADFNVPLSEGRIAETHRIGSTLPTIECLLGRARKVILASHLGRPKGKADDRWTLRPVAEYLASRLDAPVAVLTDPVDAGLVRRLREETGAIVLLESLRFDHTATRPHHRSDTSPTVRWSRGPVVPRSRCAPRFALNALLFSSDGF